ncbi:MAG: Clp protease N-terminal domain-containing protein, partial [Hyphomicrobium sp.]
MTDLAAAELAQIPMSQVLAGTLARASEGARATGASEVSLEHVLAALCDDPDAADVLSVSHIEVERLRAEVISYLVQHRGESGSHAAHQGCTPGGNLSVSVPLRRILEAAAAAARGGRRRDINGAIVLAAIVGDGRSVAAQILQAQGLTFDGAIRALQSALAQPAREPVVAVAPAEDVLARARERVQSRSAPSLREIMLDRPRAAAQAKVPAGNAGFPDLVPAHGGYDVPAGGHASAAEAAAPAPAEATVSPAHVTEPEAVEPESTADVEPSPPPHDLQSHDPQPQETAVDQWALPSAPPYQPPPSEATLPHAHPPHSHTAAAPPAPQPLSPPYAPYAPAAPPPPPPAPLPQAQPAAAPAAPPSGGYEQRTVAPPAYPPAYPEALAPRHSAPSIGDV